MNHIELKDKFSEEFFEEHMYKPLFRSIFNALEHGESPYRIIEQLCVINDDTGEKMLEILENRPTKIIVTTEQFENLTKDTKQ